MLVHVALLLGANEDGEVQKARAKTYRVGSNTNTCFFFLFEAAKADYKGSKCLIRQ